MLAQIPSAIQKRIDEKLQCTLKQFSLSSGGCINNGGELNTSTGSYFLKWNDAHRFPKMFEAEAKGLGLLSIAKAIRIPAVILNDEIEKYQFLLLEWIESKNRSRKFWENAGEQLAHLHYNSQNYFGLNHDNYVGSLLQRNKAEESWVTFFIQQRLLPQLELLSPDQSLLSKFDVLFQKLPSLLPEEKPALLHGDLWSGNLIPDESGAPCLIDPAVYYGNREIEIAFTQLFGAFDSAFYDSYQNAFRLLPGFKDRVDLYNLYPLLVHANLFGGDYLNKVKTILNRFI